LDECTYRCITVLCNSAPWRWSSTTETCRCYKFREEYIYIYIYIYIFVHFLAVSIHFSCPFRPYITFQLILHVAARTRGKSRNTQLYVRGSVAALSPQKQAFSAVAIDLGFIRNQWHLIRLSLISTALPCQHYTTNAPYLYFTRPPQIYHILAIYSYLCL
jgi:hypothetical protein